MTAQTNALSTRLAHGPLGTLIRGAIVGVAATEALDLSSTLLYERESRWRWLRENTTRGWLQAYERAVRNMARPLGVRLSYRQARRWGWRFHKAFGMLGGVQYVALRARQPKVAGGGGLGFGLVFFAVADEILMPALGLTPGPRKFSWKVHGRGLVAHVLYGVAAECTARLLDKVLPPAGARLGETFAPSQRALDAAGHGGA